MRGEIWIEIWPEKKKQKKNLEWLAGQPIKKNQKKGLVNDLDLLKNELWNAILAKKRKNTQKLITAGTQWLVSKIRKKTVFLCIFFVFCCFTMKRRPHGSRYGRPYGTAVCPPYMRRGERLQTSSSAKYWRRYLVG